MLKAIKKPTQQHPETSGFNCVGLLVNGSPGFWPDYPSFSHPKDFDKLPGADLSKAPPAWDIRRTQSGKRQHSQIQHKTRMRLLVSWSAALVDVLFPHPRVSIFCRELFQIGCAKAT
jgi:hypothetical protein